MEATIKTPMVVQTIKEFMLSNDYSIVPVVRTNINGYPYVTFVDSKNVSENIYFSKAASVSLAAGIPVTKEFVKGYQIGETINEAGEKRIKLISNSERLSVADLFD